MIREKSIQIPERLFLELAQYFLLNRREAEMEKSIVKGLSNKLEAVIRHDLYTRYKTAPTQEQQEQARKEYLDKIGIPHSNKNPFANVRNQRLLFVLCPYIGSACYSPF